jgi:hypothetical protein
MLRIEEQAAEHLALAAAKMTLQETPRAAGSLITAVCAGAPRRSAAELQRRQQRTIGARGPMPAPRAGADGRRQQQIPPDPPLHRESRRQRRAGQRRD